MKRAFSLALSCTLLFGGLALTGIGNELYASKLVKNNLFAWAPTPPGTSTGGEQHLDTTRTTQEAGTSAKPSVILRADLSVKQGEVMAISLDLPDANTLSDTQAFTAKYLERTVPLFPVRANHYEGWIPVSVFQKVGSYPLTIKDKQGRTLAIQSIKVADAHFRIQNISVTKSMGGLQPEAGELETVAKLKTMTTWQKYWDGEFISPTIDCQNSPFGNLRYHNGKPTDEYHKGVDLRSPLGRPIKAINDGKVIIARKYQLHGGTVGLDHGFGFSSIFIHMSQINVKPGQVVKKGDVIGKVGSTGFATGPHLHWGFFVGGLPVNPNQWVKGVPRC